MISTVSSCPLFKGGRGHDFLRMGHMVSEKHKSIKNAGMTKRERHKKGDAGLVKKGVVMTSVHLNIHLKPILGVPLLHNLNITTANLI